MIKYPDKYAIERAEAFLKLIIEIEKGLKKSSINGVGSGNIYIDRALKKIFSARKNIEQYISWKQKERR